ncbi:MerR family transcriptional regulator [Salipiger sp.]|uniref:MerR family transcriptional regulator n=1 Tax=Salipiger sp. TaxID=2078585 RepID=UPI0035130236
MSKSRDAFRTISEVADLLDTPAHVLRFWESKFTQVKPVKRAGGRRYYRPGDISLLSGIRTLLYDDGLTIKGVQKVLREQGVKHVASLAPLQLDEAEDVEAETVEDAPYVEAQPESGTVLPFAPVTAQKDAEAPVSAAKPGEAPSQVPETTPDDTVAPPAEVGQETVANAPEETLLDAPGAEFSDAAELSADAAPAGAQSEVAAASPDAEEDGPTIAEQDSPVPDFLAQALEERQDGTPADAPAPAPSEEAAPAFAALPEQPYGAHPEPAAEPEAPAVASESPTASDAPQVSAENVFEADPAPLPESPLPASRALPDLPDLAALPVPPAGALRHLARLDRLGASEAAALTAPVAALRNWLDRADRAAEH